MGSLIAIGLGFALGFGAAFNLANSAEGAAIEFARWPIFILGALLVAAGIAFRQWAVYVLGRFFTVYVRVSEGQKVVESGPDRVLAHPSYTGMVMVFVGIGLMLGNWLSLACLVILPIAGLVVRIKIEERALLAGIGEPDRRFLATRSRLIPGVGGRSAPPVRRADRTFSSAAVDGKSSPVTRNDLPGIVMKKL